MASNSLKDLLGDAISVPSKTPKIDEFVKKAHEWQDPIREAHGLPPFDYSLINEEYEETLDIKSPYNVIKIICPIHGVFYQPPFEHLIRKFACPKCHPEQRKEEIDRMFATLDKFKEVHGFRYKYKYFEGVESDDQEIPIICFDHKGFYQSVNDHLIHGCPDCEEESRQLHQQWEAREKAKRSNKDDLINFVKSLFPDDPDKHVILNAADVIPPQTLDIYIPEFHVAVDFNENYAHAYPNIPKNYHFEKSQACEAQGVRLIHCWQHEFNDVNKHEIIKSVITNVVQKTPNRIFARKCEIREVQTAVFRPFLVRCSPHGFRSAAVNLGLFYKDELKMFMSFGYNFFGRGAYSCEVIRVSTELYTTVIGGGDKLFKHFLKNYPLIKIGKKEVEVKDIVYYVDSDHYNGSSLSKLGFTFKHWNSPGFQNFDLITETISHRKPTQYEKIMKEYREGKHIQLYNSGTRVYVYNKEQSCLQQSENQTNGE
jgi:hypothetical protein